MMFSCQDCGIKDGITVRSISTHTATNQDINLHPYTVVEENYGDTTVRNQILMENASFVLRRNIN